LLVALARSSDRRTCFAAAAILSAGVDDASQIVPLGHSAAARIGVRRSPFTPGARASRSTTSTFSHRSSSSNRASQARPGGRSQIAQSRQRYW
jgi:hypothetical protein